MDVFFQSEKTSSNHRRNTPIQTVENVFLFFVVNQTYEFRGFARMKAPGKRNTEEIRWMVPDKMKAEGRTFGDVIKVYLDF